MGKRIRTAEALQGELKFMERSLERLQESFSLDKDSAVEEGFSESLRELRDKVRQHYGPAADSMLRELRRLRYVAGRIAGLPEAIFPRMDRLESAVKNARAHFIGTAGRLVRVLGQREEEDQCTE